MATWYFKNGEQQFGPCDDQAMRNAVNTGQIVAQTMIRQGENGNWFRADRIQGLLPKPVPSLTIANEERKPKKPFLTRRRIAIGIGLLIGWFALATFWESWGDFITTHFSLTMEIFWQYVSSPFSKE